MKTQFLSPRHIGLTAADREQMLQTIGAKSVDELIRQTMPSDILMEHGLDLPEALSEQQHLSSMQEAANLNEQRRSYIGRGWYGTITPAVIQRNVLENPVWYTSYTPYQAEVSQGRLEALFVFQTMVSDLTGLPLSNCSLLDEATAAAEAVTMMRNLRSREQVKQGVRKVFVDERIWENTKSVLCTRAAGQGIELVFGRYELFIPTAEFFGAIVQLPNADGAVVDYADLVESCHAAGLK